MLSRRRRAQAFESDECWTVAQQNVSDIPNGGGCNERDDAHAVARPGAA